MKASEFTSNLSSSIKSVGKILLKSRSSKISRRDNDQPLIILANGPSLNATMAESLETLRHFPTMTVNFAPCTDMFFAIKPEFHILADPLFFAENKSQKIEDMYAAMRGVDWKLTLLVPADCKDRLPKSVLKNNAYINVETFNFVGLEGFDFFKNLLYDKKKGMPRPRNVLVPALMCGIWLGFKEIYIAGADHSWMQTISVDENNNVISVQPHYYKEDASEQKRVDTAYRDYRLHQIVESFAIAFKSYHEVNRYAECRNVKIYNSTPGSFIDAFPRRPLPALT